MALKRKRLEVMKDNEVNYLYNAFKNHTADDSANTRSGEQCQSMSAKYDIAIAELELEVTILTATLHKEQEKVASHSARISEIEKQTQNLIADNNKQIAQSVHEKAAINMPSLEHELPINNADKGKQKEGVTLNSQKFHVESNMPAVDLSHLVNSENWNNYSNITITKGNTLLNNHSYQDNKYIAVNYSSTTHIAPAMENNTSTTTELASKPPALEIIAHKQVSPLFEQQMKDYKIKQQSQYMRNRGFHNNKEREHINNSIKMGGLLITNDQTRIQQNNEDLIVIEDNQQLSPNRVIAHQLSSAEKIHKHDSTTHQASQDSNSKGNLPLIESPVFVSHTRTAHKSTPLQPHGQRHQHPFFRKQPRHRYPQARSFSKKLISDYQSKTNMPHKQPLPWFRYQVQRREQHWINHLNLLNRVT